MTRFYICLLGALLLGALSVTSPLAHAQDRELTTAQREALGKAGDLGEESENTRPAKLPDLTKGDPVGERLKQDTWHLGPTGIIGYMPGGLQGDQIEVASVLPGSPAEGKITWGDVILSVNGQKFVAGKNMGMLFGNAIIESEREINKGVLTLRIWRDKNFAKRNGSKDIAGTDVDRLIEKAVGDQSLFDWKDEQQQQKEVRNQNFTEFPIDGHELEVTLNLAVFPDYSETSPYDCPKVNKILENAWKSLEQQFTPDAAGRGGQGGTIQAVALAASGKPEHRQLLREWVRSPRGKAWHPPTETDDPLRIPSKSWYMSLTGLDCALYYDATGDEFVLPALERFALRTARGQAGNGAWGHNWAQPSFNGGEYNGMNPGYGSLNASGNRCFLLLVLAEKHGIKSREVHEAIKRSQRFFSSYIDKGAIPYGDHLAWPSDDSNGKNSGVALALSLLGDRYGAKYFAQMCTHASFTRRGGHANDWFWHWSPWGATLAGPRGTIAAHRNMRWWYTLGRRFDGGFVNHSPGGKGTLRDATATYVLHYSPHLKQTLITGKDADESLWWTDTEFDQLLASARGQFSDPKLIEQAGTLWHERSTDDVFKLLNIFMPKTRGQVAKELAKRYKAGEKGILPRLAELLKSDDARLRDAACIGLAACGPDASLQYMSGVAKLLSDPAEFVRIQAATTMAAAANDREIQEALLKATAADDNNTAGAPTSLSSVTQHLLFGNDSVLAKSPFEAGFDEELVRNALEKLITLDPTGARSMLSSRQKVWDKSTAAHIAGPLVFTAEQEQLADQMFSSRREVSIQLLERLGYQEAVDAGASYLRKFVSLPPHIRGNVSYKRGIIEPQVLMRHPAAARQYLDDMKTWLADDPLAIAFEGKDEPSIPLYAAFDAIKAVKTPAPLPRLGDEARALFMQELDKTADANAKIAICRKELADPTRKHYFRMMAAMDHLVSVLAADALGDLLPYLNHEQWRVRDHARELATRLAGAHGESALLSAFASADESTAAGILAVLARTKTDAGRKLAEQALAHPSAVVRAAAAESLAALAGDGASKPIFSLLKSETDERVLNAAQKTILLGRKDPAVASTIIEQSVSLLPSANPSQRRTLYWLLARVGGTDAIKTLVDATNTKDDAQFRDAVWALSYCPDPAADKAMVQIIEANRDKPRASVAASEGVRRMVIGPDDIGNRPVSEQLDYADAVLKLDLNSDTITYLGRIRTGRCASILQRTMRRGNPAAAAKAIIVATQDLSDAPDADRKLAVAALVDTIEYIEVNYLRGGAMERLDKSSEAWRTYPMWKSLSAEAGRNLLKLNQTEKAPIPQFDDLDL